MNFGTYSTFCKKCLISDSFFTGGGSWAPDSCPKCKGTACVAWCDLSPARQEEAQKINDVLWKQKWGIT